MIIKGRREKGRGIAGALGFPTVNFAYNGEDSGVFAGFLLVGDRKFPAAVHLGPRPTIEDERAVCEAHVLVSDFAFEDEEVVVELIEKVRDVEKFANLEELKLQVEKDLALIREIHAKFA